jgi:hypothetical protein
MVKSSLWHHVGVGTPAYGSVVLFFFAIIAEGNNCKEEK